MIIDFHTHVFDSHVAENRSSYFDDTPFSLLYAPEKSKIVDHKSMLKAMNESGVDYAVAMGFPWGKEKYCEKQNKYFAKLKEYTGGKIIPFGSMPLGDRLHFDDWSQEIKELGMAGIGEVAFYNEGLTYRNSAVLHDLLRSASRYNLPVCLHVSEPVGKDYTGKHITDLTVLYSILKDFTDVPLILAHWGGGLVFYELMKEKEENNILKNIYYDTAASLYLYRDDIFDIAVKIAGSNKILFGSDFPLISFKKYFDAIGRVLTNEDDKKNILFGNAAGLLNNFVKMS